MELRADHPDRDGILLRVAAARNEPDMDSDDRPQCESGGITDGRG